MMHYMFAPAPAFYMPRRAFCPGRRAFGPCGISPCASPILPIAMFFLLPMLLRLGLSLIVLAMTVFVHLAPMIILALATHTLFNSCEDGSGAACKRFATQTATAADETEATPTEATKDKPSVVHNVSSATSVRLDDDKITVVFAIPGLRSEDLDVKVLDDHVLHVTGSTKKGNTTYRVEEHIQLPAVDMETMGATHEDGVLTVEVQRKIRRVTIPVKPVVEHAVEPAVESTEESQEEDVVAWAAEWDTCLSDLAEMGFEDRESNRAALAKHSGSIKLAVKELRTNRAAA